MFLKQMNKPVSVNNNYFKYYDKKLINNVFFLLILI